MALRVRHRRIGSSPPEAAFEDPDDDWLVEGLRGGNEAAFRALLRRHEGAMLRLARFHVSCDAAAEDVVQETWLAILRGIDGFDGRSTLKTWMYRILTNRAKTTGQREGRALTDSAAVAREVERKEPAVPADRFLDPLAVWPRHWSQPPLAWEAGRGGDDIASVAEVVAQAIATLTSMQRIVITLRDGECWTARDVCNVLSLTETNQRVLLHRARSKVRQHLEHHFGAAEQD